MLPFDHLGVALSASERSVDWSDLGPQESTLADNLHSWAHELLAAGAALQARRELDKLPGSDIVINASVRNALAQSDMLREFLQFELLRESCTMTFGAYSKLVDHVVPRLVTTKLNAFSWRYLSRVARLYIWGFEGEVYVMARATLDSALQELLPEKPVRHAMQAAAGTKKVARPTLGHRLQFARFSTPVLLDAPAWRDAFYLTEDGNDVLHKDVSHTLHFSAPLQAIDALVRVLSRLPVPGTAVRINPVPANAAFRPRG